MLLDGKDAHFPHYTSPLTSKSVQNYDKKSEFTICANEIRICRNDRSQVCESFGPILDRLKEILSSCTKCLILVFRDKDAHF